MSLVGILFLVVTGVISYNLTNASYAKWSSSIESKNIIKLSVKSSQKEMTAVEFAQFNVGKNGLKKITHEIDDTLQVDNRAEIEYRYIGNDLKNNYIWFNCSSENQDDSNCERWRIIGIIPTDNTTGNIEKRLKLIRGEALEEMYWNECENDASICNDTGKNINDWTGSTLNTYLNEDYYNSLFPFAQSMIGPTKYYLGDGSGVSNDPSMMWQYERKKANDDSTQYYLENSSIMQNDASKKIALMYGSDFMYITEGYSDSSSWITQNQWTLNPSTRESYFCAVDGVADSAVCSQEQYPVQLTLTLVSWIKISGGDGSYDNPYTLSIPQNVFGFVIGETEYYAYEGMTWKDWITSDFNTNFKNENGLIITNDDTYYVEVQESDTINPETVYNVVN